MSRSKSKVAKVEKRATVLSGLKRRLRKVLGKRSALLTNVMESYKKRDSGLQGLRDIVRSVASQVPGGMMVCGDVSSVTKRTELLRRLASCLENAGYSSSNVFRPSGV
jgi:hypothetical protein